MARHVFLVKSRGCNGRMQKRDKIKKTKGQEGKKKKKSGPSGGVGGRRRLERAIEIQKREVREPSRVGGKRR